ncbi:RNA polymerase, sigma 54 subunit, RpoN/SigL [Palleronia pelagia]|uniref:RNA polymerase sigma-54 factor n=2 Tax=Palleronia pelagia TaxID=387096 RepID=A0A1H8LC48_9RHOB|nr:RNA polymerase, sigma 54 subunit, RpoN/SigL [Palleronia pelagia]
MSHAMKTSVRILSLTGATLDAFLSDLVAANPYLRRRRRAYGSLPEYPIAERNQSMHQSVLERLSLERFDLPERKIVMALLEGLEPTGWMTEPLERIAKRTGASITSVQTTLKRVQDIAPAGMFARSLSECLRLQLERNGELTWDLSALLGNLSLVAEGRLEELAEKCDCSLDDLTTLLGQLRRLDPKPGLQFDVTPLPPAQCDLIVRRDGTGWRVESNEEETPSLSIEAGPDADATLLAEARSVVDAMALRRETSVRVASVLVELQSDFVADATAPRKPVRQADVANRLSLHASTVSRAVRDRTLDVPRGRLPLKSLFCPGAPGDGHDGLSQDAVLIQMRKLVASESRHRPLTDGEIARALVDSRVTIARRTVAKYRHMLGIAAAPRRAEPANGGTLSCPLG